jgi:hypothetical protein
MFAKNTPNQRLQRWVMAAQEFQDRHKVLEEVHDGHGHYGQNLVIRISLLV